MNRKRSQTDLTYFSEVFRTKGLLLLSMFVIFSPVNAGQRTKRAEVRSQPSNELARLREDFTKATKEYKASLEKLIASYELSVKRAEARLTQSRELYDQGLISKVELTESETALALAKNKVTNSRQQLTNADTQIAATLVEAKTEAQVARLGLRKGSLLSTTSYIRYNGGANFVLPEAWKVQKFFQDAFQKPLPIAVFGQGSIHDRWRLDHRNSMDISLHPDGVEGQALIAFLRKNRIPFLAFRTAIPGTATGPHIHIGRPSHRF